MIRLDLYDNSAFDRGAPGWKEAAWMAVKILFFLTAVPWPSGFKAGLLRLFGAQIGPGLVIRPRVNITFPWRFSCGSHVWIGEETLILSLAPVTIGSHVCLSQRAFLCSGSHDFRSNGFDLRTEPICVGDHCWIGAGAFVGPGVRVGTGCRVAALARIVQDVPDGHHAEGNPAICRPLMGHSSQVPE